MSPGGRRAHGFIAKVKSGEPVATWLGQSLPLIAIIPLSLWIAADRGNLTIAAAGWLVGSAAFNLWWLPYLRRSQHPPAGTTLSIAIATSSFVIVQAPEMGPLLVTFSAMGVALGLAAGGRLQPVFQGLCVLTASYSMVGTDALSTRAWVILVALMFPMALTAVAFAVAELGHREKMLDDALFSSGGTAWDMGSDGLVHSSLGLGIPGIGVGTQLSHVIHSEDHRPTNPKPGTTLEYRVEDGAGGWRWIREHVQATTRSREQGRSAVTDITAEKEVIANDQRRANLDQLTDLPNRSNHIRTTTDWTSRESGSLILVDLDDFKQINDTFGHTMGDQVLREVARRLNDVEGIAHVARLGGDEFACLVEGDQKRTQEFADRLISELVEPFSIDQMSIYTGASVGTAGFGEGVNADEVRRRAGVALREAKSTGGIAIEYNSALEKQSAMMKSLAVDLPSAFVEGDLVVHYQPKLDLLTKQVVGYEALIRWQHTRHGLLSPDKFLELISVGGFHRQLFQLVLQESLASVASLRGDACRTVSVNIHAVNLREPDLVDRTLSLIEATDLTPQDLILELTEEALITGDKSVTRTLHELYDAGVGLSVDDFGSGFSSLAYLSRLPVCEVKLDRELVSQVTESTRAQAVVETVLWLASRLELEVVAEGIEDQETFDYLLDQGCSQGQGYLIGKPNSLAHWAMHNAQDPREFPNAA